MSYDDEGAVLTARALDAIQIELSQGKVALIDAGDYALVSGYKWHAVPRQYTWYAETHVRRGGKRATQTMHCLIMDPPSGMTVDHWDNDALNNTRGNLRLATYSQQNANTRRMGSSGYRGVCRHRDAWRAAIHIDGAFVHLGRFRDPSEAAHVYDAKAREVYGPFARLNFPMPGSTERKAGAA